MLNVFLDSNIIFADPFFKENFSRKFIESLKEIEGTIFISNLVYEESKNNYIREVRKRRKEFGKTKHSLNKLLVSEIDNTLKTDDDYLKEFVEYYQNFIETGLITVINHEDFEMFNEIVKRSLLPKKPFAHHKEEFKDTVIWLSYSNFVEKHELSDCFFVTNNTTDYYDNDKTQLHPDLLEDTMRIKPYKSIEDFMKNEVEPLLEKREKQAKQLLDWQKSNLKDEYVENLIRVNFIEELADELSYFSNHLDSHEVRRFAGIQDSYYVEFQNISKFSLDTYEREVFSDEIIIYGSLNIWSNVSLFINSLGKVKEDFNNAGLMSINQKVEFTFIIDLDFLPKNFEVKDIEPIIWFH